MKINDSCRSSIEFRLNGGFWWNIVEYDHYNDCHSHYMIYRLQKGSYNLKFMKSLRLERAWNRNSIHCLTCVKIAKIWK